MMDDDNSATYCNCVITVVVSSVGK